MNKKYLLIGVGLIVVIIALIFLSTPSDSSQGNLRNLYDSNGTVESREDYGADKYREESTFEDRQREETIPLDEESSDEGTQNATACENECAETYCTYSYESEQVTCDEENLNICYLQCSMQS